MYRSCEYEQTALEWIMVRMKSLRSCVGWIEDRIRTESLSGNIDAHRKVTAYYVMAPAALV